MMRGRSLAGLVAIATLLRVALVLALWRGGARPYTYEHGEIAQNLLSGRGFSVCFLGQTGPTSQQAPFYPALLAAVAWCFPQSATGIPPGALLTMQLLQCAVGGGCAGLTAVLAGKIAPGRARAQWLAGGLVALSPVQAYMATHIQTVPWIELCLLAATVLCVSPPWRAWWSKPLLAGLIAGVLLLCEPILALALPWLAVALGWNQRRGATAENVMGPDSLAWPQVGGQRDTGWLRVFLRLDHRGPALMTAVTCLAIAPWLVRNRQVHGEWVFIKSTFGYALWQGNNPASWGTDKIPKPSATELALRHDGSLAQVDQALRAARSETLYIDDVLLKPNGYREFRGLSEPQRSRLLQQRATDFILQQPASYARLCGQRLTFFLLFDATNPKTLHPAYQVSTLAWLITTMLGMVLARRDFARWWPLAGVFFTVTLFHVLTIVSVRFRLPLEPLGFALAGVGLATWWRSAAPQVWMMRLRHAPTTTLANGDSPASKPAHAADA